MGRSLEVSSCSQSAILMTAVPAPMFFARVSLEAYEMACASRGSARPQRWSCTVAVEFRQHVLRSLLLRSVLWHRASCQYHSFTERFRRCQGAQAVLWRSQVYGTSDLSSQSHGSLRSASAARKELASCATSELHEACQAGWRSHVPSAERSTSEWEYDPC